jgi:phage-related protein
VRAWWDENGAAIMAAVQTVWATIQSVISTVITTISTIVSTVLSGIRAFWDTWGSGLLTAATGIWDAIKGLIEGVVEQIKGIVELFTLAMSGDWEAFGAKLFELWQNAWQTIIDFISGIWESIRPLLAQLWGSIKSWWSSIDWGQLGRDLIDGIVRGLQNAGQAIVDVILGFASAAEQAIKNFFGISSPSKLMIEVGEAIGKGLIIGIEKQTAGLETAVERQIAILNGLTGTAGAVHGIGSGVFNFQAGALAEQITRNEELMDRWMGSLAEDQRKRLEAIIAAGPKDPAELLAWLPQQLRYLRESGQGFAGLEDAIRLADERNALEAEYLRQQRELATLEAERTKLDFLQQQVDLLELIKENNLDVSILDGLALGINANVTDIIAAMTAAMAKLVDKTEQTLGIASPSAVFRKVGENIMKGLELGIANGRSLEAVVQRRLQELSLGMPLSADQTVYIFGGYNPVVGQRQTAADPLRDLYLQSL